MGEAATRAIVRQMEELLREGTLAGLCDRQLLARVSSPDDRTRDLAFAALVSRHGPMVLAICRQLLGDVHHAEDAFQAVFLVLARKAGSIRDPDLLSNWLHGVALRTARKARAQRARRLRAEEAVALNRHLESTEAPSADVPVLARDEADALHQEIGRLARSFRLPIVLCYLEGLTLDEAAHRLRWPAGTLRSRLARARDKLRHGLTRRGIVLSAGTLSLVLRPRPVAARIPSSLCTSTTRAAVRFALHRTTEGVVSAATAHLAQEVLQSMFMNSIKTVSLSIAAMVLVATGAGYLAHSRAAGQTRPGPAPAPTARAPRAEQPVPAPGTMVVTGRVLDPDGKPVLGADVNIIGRPRAPWVHNDASQSEQQVLGLGQTDADGRFRLEAARSASNRFFTVHAMAQAPGLALGWAELNADAQQPAADIRLRIPQSIQGTLVSSDGKPAAGVEIRVWSIGRPLKTGLFDGVNMGSEPIPVGLTVWPRDVTTNDEGRFTIVGAGRDLEVGLSVNDPRYARNSFRVKTDDRAGPKEETLKLGQSVTVSGQVLAGDTGKPVPQAFVAVTSANEEFELGIGTPHQADNNGRFSRQVAPREYYSIQAFPPEALPYVWTRLVIEQPKEGALKPTDVKLVPGVILRGKVTEHGTGRHVSGAPVQYLASRRSDSVIDGWQSVVVSKADGSFQIAVLPGKGHLFVYGPTSDYVINEIGSRMIYGGQPGGTRFYAHAIVPYEVKAGEAPREVNVELKPGKTVRGRLIGPDGQTVDNAMIIGLLHFNYFHLNWRGDLARQARDGLFEIRGLDPEKPTRVSFLDADHQWGATVELSGKQAEEAVEIRLQPCGQAKARFVGPDGKPVARIFPHFEILGSQGPNGGERLPELQAQLAADSAYLPNVDRTHYWGGRFTDADGRLVLPDLIPGAWYRINDFSPNGHPDSKGPIIRRDFSVKPGETVDLGDILVEKPQP